MTVPPIPAHEAQRLAALHALAILDTPPEQVFDDLVEVASAVCAAPIALLSLVDSSRVWFKARVGLDLPETSRDASFSAHAVASGELLMVPDATADPRFADNPLVLGAPHLRMYAGAPLLDDGGLALGTLCVMDREARALTEVQRGALLALARQAVASLSMRRALSLERLRGDRLRDDFVSTMAHELRTPLTSVRGALGLLTAGHGGVIPESALPLLQIAESNALRLAAILNDGLDVLTVAPGEAQRSPQAHGVQEQPAPDAAGPVDRERVVGAVADSGPSPLAPRVLHIEDDRDVLALVRGAFGARLTQVVARTLEEARIALREQEFDAVLLDLALPDGHAFELLDLIAQRAPHAPIVVFGGAEVSGSLPGQVAALLVKSRVAIDEVPDVLLAVLEQRRR